MSTTAPQPPVLTVSVYGGLGNQMFQLFALFAEFFRSGRKVVLKEVYCNESHRRRHLDGLLLHNFKPFLDLGKEYDEKTFLFTKWNEKRFSPLVEYVQNMEQNIYFYGTFQDYKLFDDQIEKILHFINYRALQNNLKNSVQVKLGKFIALHFRLGDYLDKQHYHPVLPVKYYVNALCHICLASKEKDWEVVVFSELSDRKLVDERLEELKKEFPEVTFIHVAEGMDEETQIILMSMASHNIIANSTFSWWGAYLNTNRNCIRCYPSSWFGYGLRHINTELLFPFDWKRIPCG